MILFAICLWLPITISYFSISFVCACSWWNILSWQSSLLQIQTLAMTHVFCLVPLKLTAYVNMLWIFCMSPPIPQIGPEALCFWVVLHFVCVCVCFHMYVHVWVLRHSPSGLILSKFAIWNKLPSVLWRCWLGGRKGIRPVKNWVVECWLGYLPGARCRLAYGPADATATHYLLLQ